MQRIQRNEKKRNLIVELNEKKGGGGGVVEWGEMCKKSTALISTKEKRQNYFVICVDSWKRGGKKE